LTTTVSALAIDGAAMAMVASAAITYPIFFMLSSSVEQGINFASEATFPKKPRRILNGCSGKRTIAAPMEVGATRQENQPPVEILDDDLCAAIAVWGWLTRHKPPCGEFCFPKPRRTNKFNLTYHTL
jgi:hypothetical protein